MRTNLIKLAKILVIIALPVVGFFFGRLSLLLPATRLPLPIFDEANRKFNWTTGECHLYGIYGKSCSALTSEGYTYVINQMNSYYQKQKPVVNVQYNAPRPSSFQLPECTKCDFDYMGKWVCKTERSISCY